MSIINTDSQSYQNQSGDNMFKSGDAYFRQTQIGESRWWSWIAVFSLTIAALIISNVLLAIPMAIEMFRTAPDAMNDISDKAAQQEILMNIIGSSPLIYGLMLLTFPVTLIGTFFGTKVIHNRTVKSLITAASKIRWSRMLFAALLTFIVYGAITYVTHLFGLAEVKFTFDPKRFFVFAAVSVLLIPLQSAMEEIIFRGYLNQGFGHYIKNKWVVFVITSALFAAMHLANPESVSGAEKGAVEHFLVMSSYFLFGFILCVIVFFEGGLEAVIGVHAANNIFAAVFVNYEGSALPTPSLFLSPKPENTDNLFAMVILAAIMLILYKTRSKEIAA